MSEMIYKLNDTFLVRSFYGGLSHGPCVSFYISIPAMPIALTRNKVKDLIVALQAWEKENKTYEANGGENGND